MLYPGRILLLTKKGIAMNFSIKAVAKHVYEAIRSASLYTILISLILLVFIANTGFDSAAIMFGDYVTIILASLLIAFANLLFKIKRLPKFISFILHYSALVFGLTVVFIFSDKLLLKQNPSQAFSLLLVFTILYALLSVLLFFVKRILRKIANALPSDSPSEKHKEEQSEDEYRSIL